MTEDYCYVQDIKDNLPDITVDTTYELMFNTLITRASRAIDTHLKREPGAFAVIADSTRYFTGSGDDKLWVGEMAAAPTSIAVAEAGVLTTLTTWAATDYYCWPYNALAEGMPYLRLDVDTINGTKYTWYDYPKAVRVIGKFGFSASAPAEIVQATIIQVMRWFKRGQQAYQDTGAIVELAQLRYTRKLDPDVETLLSLPKFQLVTI